MVGVIWKWTNSSIIQKVWGPDMLIHCLMCVILMDIDCWSLEIHGVRIILFFIIVIRNRRFHFYTMLILPTVYFIIIFKNVLLRRQFNFAPNITYCKVFLGSINFLINFVGSSVKIKHFHFPYNFNLHASPKCVILL